MRKDEVRSARLLFADALADGTVDEAAVTSKHVLSEVASKPVPTKISRNLQRVLVKRGKLSQLDDVLAFAAIRARVLGDEAAAGPPKFLVRVDEFPHYEAWDKPERYGTEAFARFHRILTDAGVPYLIAVTPRVPRHPMDPAEDGWRPHDPGERAMLAELRGDGVAFAVHGLDHRTRETDPRKHAELVGRSEDELEERLDLADAVLAEQALDAPVFVPPFNRFEHRQYRQLARRYEIVCSGPETVRLLGWHRGPMWRGDAVHLPCLEPFYGRADALIPQVEALAERRPGVWVPLTLHWGWERDEDWQGLERFARAIAGMARPWDELLAAARWSGKAPVRR